MATIRALLRRPETNAPDDRTHNSDSDSLGQLMAKAITSLACCLALTCALVEPAQGATPVVVVDISGELSSDPAEIILIGDPGPFPMPELLGGSFAGHFSYVGSRMGIRTPPTSSVRDFPFSRDIFVEVRDGSGNLVYTIDTSPDPFKVGVGSVRFPVGISPFNGGPSETPSRLSFALENPVFHSDNVFPPTSEQLNAADIQIFAPNVDSKIELFSPTDPFDKWKIPFELTISARTVLVPEPSGFNAMLIVLGLLAAWRRRSGGVGVISP